MMKPLLALVGVGLLSAACGSSPSPTAPTSAATSTRIITVSGDLAFGNVNMGATGDRTFTIGNSGNATLTFTGTTAVCCTGTAGFTASPSSGTIAPGATQTVSIHFAPTIAQFYSAVLTIASDRTSGGNEINMSGTGVGNPQLFEASGTDSAVFSMPTTVARVTITADYSGSSSIFAVVIDGRLTANVIVGTSDGNSTHFEGTYLTAGGVVQVTSSGAWSFTEVR